MNQQDIDELTEVFVEESQEIVENLNKDVLDLEQYVGNPTLNRELLNNIFRYVHTLKGNSGLAGADKLRDLAHKMESLLDRLRKDKITLSSEIVDLLFDGIDRISSILQEVISGVDHNVVIDDLIERLEGILSGKPIEAKKAPSPEPEKAPPSPKDTPPPVSDQKKQPAPKPEERPSIPITLDSEDIEQYPIPDDIKRVLTEYEEKRVIENIRSNAHVYEVLLNLAMERFEHVVTIVIDAINELGEVIAKVPSSKTLPGYDLQVRVIFASSTTERDLESCLATLDVLSKGDFTLNLLLDASQVVLGPSSSPQTQELSSDIFDLEIPTEKILGATASPTQEKPAPAPAAKTSPEPPAAAGEHKPATPQPAAKPEPKRPPHPQNEPSPKEPPEKSKREVADQTGNTVRVDIKKLDNLMNIVGELVLAKARYVQIESELDGDSVYKTLRDNLRQTNKLSSKKLEDLREGILQVRMVQVGALFNRFPRLVRDLAKAHDKKIKLVLEGKETELDKAVIDEMGDPLMHLMKNSADHGIEAPEVRRRKGKPETGTVTLRAYQEGSYIVIEVQDDGAGLNVERIREKAIENGLLDKSMRLSESEILNFIFHPGFSTAKKVTDTSGRGVGMDVVKFRITRLKGIIDIQTIPNVGTKFIIKLPLTLAIIQVLLIRMDEYTYAIPLSSVTESFRLNPEKVEIIDGQEVTQLRDIVLPLLRLNDAFGVRDEESGEWTFPTPEFQIDNEGENRRISDKRQFVVVVGLAERKIGVVVDELLEQQEIVIKPLGRYLVNTPGFAGATTLGDGRIVLILDVVRLVESLNQNKINLLRQFQEEAAMAG